MELKPGYKQTDVGVIPEDWTVETLGELGQAIIGLTYKPEQVADHGTLILRSSNIQHCALNFEDNVYVLADVPSEIMAQPGDVLICVRNGSRELIGKTALLDERTNGMAFGAFMAVFRSPIGSLINYHFQSSVLKRQIKAHLGATINQITNKSLRSFQVTLPPTKRERDSIVEALEDIDDLIGNANSLIAKKRDIKQATMQELLTGKRRLPGFEGEWEVKRLGEIGSTFGGLTGKTKSDFGNGDAHYVSFMNVMVNVEVDCEFFERVRVAPNESQNRVLRGDLLFNGSSETPDEVAMCSLLTKDVSDLFLNSFCFGYRLRADAPVNGLFLTYLIRSNVGREVIKSLAQGSTRYNLSKRALLCAGIRLPAIGEQIAIAASLSEMDAELAALVIRHDKARSLKQGMMQQLLTGKIRLI
jgi:type I restriction enzyme S subunit